MTGVQTCALPILMRFYGGETLVRDYPVLAGMVAGMDKHSLILLNKMRAAQEQ